MILPTLKSTLFPYTTLFRSQQNTAKEPRWISFKEADEFFIRLLDPSGETVFLSQAFSAPKEMGQAMRALQNGQFKLEETEDRIILYVDEKEITSLSPEQGELVRRYCLN